MGNLRKPIQRDHQNCSRRFEAPEIRCGSREIERDYTKWLDANQSKLDALERRLADAEDNENLQRIWMRQIEEAKRRIKEEQEIIEEAKKHARTSYLKMLKKDLCRQIDEQLSVPDGKMIIDLKAGVRESLQRSIQPLVQALHKLWIKRKMNTSPDSKI